MADNLKDLLLITPCLNPKTKTTSKLMCATLSHCWFPKTDLGIYSWGSTQSQNEASLYLRVTPSST